METFSSRREHRYSLPENQMIFDERMFFDNRDIPQPAKLRYRRAYNDSLASSLNESDYFDNEPLVTQQNVTEALTNTSRIMDFLSRLPWPRLSVTGMGIVSFLMIFIAPKAICATILYPGFRLLFGTLYPAYASYKAVRTKNVKEYVKWMMYWIVFAFFTCIETFTDILFSWFPFYYEIKVIIVLWLLSPATRGSSTLYRKFVHPMLTRREQDIDDYINQAKEKGYTAVLQLGSKGVNYATNVIMQTAIKGGGGLVQTLKKSYSLSDLSEPDLNRTQDEIDDITRPQRILRSKTTRSSSSGRNVDMYFPEVELTGRQRDVPPDRFYIRSTDDISSGYSSAEPGLSRTASLSSTTARPRLKSKTREGEDDVFYDGHGIDIYPTNSQNLLPLTFHELTDKRPISRNKIVEIPNDPQSITTEPVSVPKGMEDRYEMFLKWIEENQSSSLVPKSTQIETKTENQEVQFEDKGEVVVEKDNENICVTLDDPTANLSNKDEVVVEDDNVVSNSDKIESIESMNIDVNQNNLGDELFKDTISISSEEPDEFLDLENDFEPELLKIEETDNFDAKYDRRDSSVFDEALNGEEAIRSHSVVDDFQTENYSKEYSDSSAKLDANIELNRSINEVFEPILTSENFPTQVDSAISKTLIKDFQYTEDQKEASSEELKIVEEFELDKSRSTNEICSIPDENVLVEAKMVLSDSKLRIKTSTSNLSTSTNSLCTSDGSSSNVEERSHSRPSFRSKGKAPPIPTERIEIIAPIRPLKSIAIPKPASPIPEPRTRDKDKRKSKLMSSITGIFKQDQQHHKEVQPNESLHPSHLEDNVTSLKETQI